MSSEYKKIGNKIVHSVGGKNNISEVYHCIARIRIHLKEKDLLNEHELKKIPQVLEVTFEHDELQILIGNDVDKYTEAVTKIINANKDYSRAKRGEIKMSKSSNKDKQLAQEIVKLVGGKENVNSLVHCVTRLRFKLKDESKANDSEIKQLKGVMGVAHAGGQYQVIIGSNVADVYDEVMPLLGLASGNTSEDTNDETDKNVFNKFIKLITRIFTPFLGTLAAAGVLKGFLVLLTVLNLVSQKSGTYMILNAAGDALFYFLPIMVGFSSAKAFKINEYLGAIIGAALCYPTLVQAYQAKQSISFLNIPVILMNYTQTLIPAIVAVWLASIIYKWLNKVLPDSLKSIFSPLITLVVVVPLSFLIVGPITSYLSQGLANIVLWVYEHARIVAGFILAGIWQAVVLLGLHWAFIPIFLNNIATKGFDPINAMLYCTVFGQVGAALAMTLKAKSTKFKEVGWPAVISGFLGITEPIIYGVTLPHKKSFIFASIGSAFGGAVAAMSSAKMFGGFASGGIFGIPMFLDPKYGANTNFIGFSLSLIIAFVIALILTLIWGDSVVDNPKNNEGVKTAEFKDSLVSSPLQGSIVDLKHVNDAVFSSETIGQGLAINPKIGKITAPFDGKVVSVFSTKHAIGLRSNSGVELLIHVGIDTVNLKGKYFESFVKNGDEIKQGQLLENFDIEEIQKAGYDTIVPVVVTNYTNFDNIILEKKEGDNIEFGDQLILATVDQELDEASAAIKS
ncbi:PTS system beta-glucosides-specific IIC component [Lactobacillus colini]|uniref:PTS system beta-glucosides-specific IIC component n=1 Tax=Lactobacillus colini TaxID=1819254 RepID=A0ABS4MFK3_9LACO|nr:beta-glucoside-specific PTS transporter subunit IIABC [Lactobacillus colini]MBP2058466.1 PTS system beta-glucosides-specific IIC component [Lactobacillus colini]